MVAYYSAYRAALACLAIMLVAPGVLAEELSLQQALVIATSNNPTVAAGRLSSDAARQSARGAHAPTNPEILVAPSVVGDAGSDSAVVFSQPLEINGSRKVRGSIAANLAAAASSEADVITRKVVLDVSQSYWDIARSQELVKLSEDNVGYLEAVRAAVGKQYDVGAAPGAQVLKMEVELARARQELAQAALELTQAKMALNALMNRPASTDFTLSDTLKFSPAALDGRALQAAAAGKRPEVAIAQDQLLAARGEIKAARLLRVPDLALQARRESFDKDSDGGVAIAISIPVLDWGSAKAEKQRATLEAQSREKQLEAVRNAVSLDVDQAMQRANTAHSIVREYEGGILEKSEQLAAMARKGYEKGASSYLEVLEAQRTLRSIKTAYYSALAEHTKALAQLEWASGGSIAEVKK